MFWREAERWPNLTADELRALYVPPQFIDGWHARSYPAQGWVNDGSLPRRLGFYATHYHDAKVPGDDPRMLHSDLFLRVPHWSLMLIGMIAPLTSLARMRKRRRLDMRMRTGRCVACGYDLRASSGRCPECGAAAIAAAPSAA
jgi:hypothetical protein